MTETKWCKTWASAQPYYERQIFKEIYDILVQWSNIQSSYFEKNCTLEKERLHVDDLNDTRFIFGRIQIDYVQLKSMSRLPKHPKVNVILKTFYKDKFIYQTDVPIKNGFGLVTKIITDCNGDKIPESEMKNTRILTNNCRSKDPDFLNWKNSFDDDYLYQLTILIMNYYYVMAIIFNDPYIVTYPCKFMKHNDFVIDKILPINKIDVNNLEYFKLEINEERFNIPCFDIIIKEEEKPIQEEIIIDDNITFNDLENVDELCEMLNS